eukprot:10466830-Karenia_brevis.AAC.1
MLIAYRHIANPVNVEVVGDGKKQSGTQAIVPAVMKTSDGRLVESEHHVPILPEWDIPALLGLR